MRQAILRIAIDDKGNVSAQVQGQITIAELVFACEMMKVQALKQVMGGVPSGVSAEFIPKRVA